MGRIRLVHIVEDMGMGGIEKTIYNIATALNPDRYDVRVWCLTRGGVMAQELLKTGIAVEVLDMGPKPTFSFLRRLARELRENRIDIVHTHGYTACTVGRTAAVMAGTPEIFAHAHTTVNHYTARQRFIEKILSLFTDGIICCSKAVAESVAARENIPCEKLHVIYNGSPRLLVPEAPGLRRELGIPEGNSVVLCAASITKNKGHAVLISAFAEVLRRLPETNLIIAGSGPLLDKCRQQAQELRIADSIIFAGVRTDLQGLLSVADLAVLASTEREGLSLWLVEAMSAGKPLVASALGGITEVVEDRINGLLVPPSDAEALAHAICLILANREKAVAMAEASLELWAEKFTMPTMISSLETLYNEHLHD